MSGMAPIGAAPIGGRLVTPAASTYTASAALSIGAATAAGSASFTAPVYTASAALTVGAATAAASALFYFQFDLFGYRFREDDGDEDGATWIAAQNTPVSREKNTPLRIRIGSDTTGDQPTQALKLQYRKVGDPDWEDVS